VFRLEPAARAHLADLARPARQRVRQTPPQRVRPAMQQMIASMSEHPAVILGRRTDVLAANLLARALLTDWTRLPARDRNYTRWIFLDPDARAAFLDWPSVAADVDRHAAPLRRPQPGRHQAQRTCRRAHDQER
jgi:hypothetical protein